MATPINASHVSFVSPANTANPVEYTISQDRGAGNTAQVEAGYALLAGKDFGLANVQQQQQQQQNTRSHSHALQNYQMQLMLLEQQNKKRLLLARQEQDSMSLRDMPSTRGSDEFGTGGGNSESEDQDSATEDNAESSRDTADENSSRESRSGSVNAKMKKRNFAKFKANGNLEPPPNSDTDACTKSQERLKRPRKEPSSISKGIHSADRGQEHEGQGRHGSKPIHADSEEAHTEHAQYLILYRVVCSDHKARCHRRIYQDEPRRVPINNGRCHHLRGSKPIPDLDDFLQSFPETAFIVYRDCFCEKGTRSSFLGANSSNPVHKFFREIVSMVSEELHSILQESSMFAPNNEAYKMDGYEPDHVEASPALSASPSEYSHRFLYHHRQVLDTKSARAPGGSPIKALVSYMQSHPDPMYQKCDDLFSRGMVTQDTLPWLFFPNEVVVSSEGPLHIAYVVRRVPMEGATLRLVCWNWGYDGHWLHRKDNTLPVQIPSYGEVRIDSLAVYPQRFAAKAVTEGILENGKKFWSLNRQVLASYEGLDYQGERTYPCDSRFMIDYQVYSKFHRFAKAFDFSKKERAAFDVWPENISRHQSLPEVQLMLLPSGIHGFYLKEKKWMHLLVKNIQPVNWNKTAFEQLVLPKRTKNLVKGLVMVRKQTLEDSELQIGLKGKRDDIIAGKGSGLIMLLHGGPGTGKTLTAESVAELAEMPLYSVTCGDIGTSPEAVEKYLNSVLYLGKKWNCVLLLDEADVFLEERSLSDLERNSLVSVFLRTLEYYDGVLILTSNRVGTFDEAFKSRIQLALHYPPLDAPGRRKIWHNFLNMLESNDEKADIDDIKAHMDQLAGYELNGRQIRNALTTARQLSLFEQETLDWDRVKDSIEVAGDFTKYIKEVHGHTDEEWSRDNNLR